MIKSVSTVDWRTRARATFTSLVCFGLAIFYPTEAKTQTYTVTGLPTPIPTIQSFFQKPSSASARISLDIAEPDAVALGKLKVIAYPGLPSLGAPPPGIPVIILWNHEQLLNSNNQLVKQIHLVADFPFAGQYPDAFSNPATFSYTLQAMNDTYGQQSMFLGTLQAASLTLNPSNPGHTGPPIVHLFAGSNSEPLPASITFGSNLNLVATALGNPASYKITRLGIKITEILDNDHPLLNHNSGLGPGFYAPPEVMQSASSNSAVKFSYTPPILPPGSYQIVATAWDNVGFSRSLSKNLTVTRSFGFFSVSDIVRHENPDHSINFTALLELANHTIVPSGPLRIRLLAVAGSAFRENQIPPQLPPPVQLTSASIGPVTPLSAGAVEHVQVGGIAPPPDPSDPDPTSHVVGIGYQIYALLEVSNAGQWLKLDSIKVTEGVWPAVVFGGGPGLGVVAPRPGIDGSSFDPNLKLLKNISTRARVLTGNNVLIAGFIVTGNASKKVIIRGIGPSLTQSHISGVLADPILELHKPDGTVVTNDNWRSSQAAEIQATGIPPQNNLESTIVATLAPNKGYTAIMRGKNNGIGVGLVEVYDLDAAADSQLINISSRGFVETGNNVMIGGIIVGASGKLLLRAIGPSLPSSILNRLQDPILELHDGNGALIVSNDNWKTNQATAIQATGAAPTNDHESAIVTTLLPGNYTAIVKGKNNSTGVGLVECYNVQ